MGYDIADYEDIDPCYGTLADVDNLIAECKKRDMKLVMDLVVNHTSEEHAWFLDSRASKTSSKRDWYIWKPAKYDSNGNRQPPNNWAQILGEANSAWTWDENTQEYYLSLFTPEQPDLNWENPAVRAAVHAVLKFWLDRGCSGFRMDVINLISKVQDYPDADIVVKNNKYQPGDKYYANGPRLHEYLKEINRKVLSKYDTLTVGEMPFVRDEDEIMRVVGAESEELNMIFSFDLVDIDNVPGDFKFTLHPWDATDLKRIVNRLQRLMLERDGWNSLFVENHDQPRSVSRYTDDSDEFREYGAKLLALMQSTLAGTIYVYQGEELGMRNVPSAWDESEYKDIESINLFKKCVSQGGICSRNLHADKRYLGIVTCIQATRKSKPWRGKSCRRNPAIMLAHPCNGLPHLTLALQLLNPHPGCASTTTTKSSMPKRKFLTPTLVQEN
jgi:oligo-1,6-glucosidase